MAENKGVMVCGEVSDGKLTAMTLELLGGGRKLVKELDLTDEGLPGKGDDVALVHPNLNLAFQNDEHPIQGLSLPDNALSRFASPQRGRIFQLIPLRVGQSSE